LYTKIEVQAFLDRIEETNAKKMRAAATGGSPGLGPTEAEQQLAKQQSALYQQAA
jgi:hypothetical protein